MDEPLTMEQGGQTYYYHRDALGNVTEVTNVSGTLIERYEYDVYGTPSFFDGSYAPLTASTIGNPYLFTGREYDPESGNYYYRARIYSPTLGRFLSMDPMGYGAGDANLYRYVFNNSVNHTDPSGQFLDTFLDVGFIVYDVYVLIDHLDEECANTEEDLLALALDAGGLLVPFATGGGVALRTATRLDDLSDASRFLSKLDDAGGSAKILIVGENSFDFSLALRNKLGDLADIVATSFESLQDLLTRGFNPPASNSKFTVMNGVDATNLAQYFDSTKFDVIIFNNPHAGSGSSTASLIEDFLESSLGQINPGGQIHINITEKLVRKYESVARALGLSALEQLENIPRFGDSPFFVPFTPRYSTGGPILYYGKHPERLLNFVFGRG